MTKSVKLYWNKYYNYRIIKNLKETDETLPYRLKENESIDILASG